MTIVLWVTVLVIGYMMRLWTAIKQPTWMADTGIPIALTLLGLGLAYLGLRRQLASDRELFALQQRNDRELYTLQQQNERELFGRQQQAERELFRLQQENDRQLRRADHKREVALKLGRALIKAAECIRHYDLQNAAWLSRKWVDAAPLEDAIKEAQDSLPSDQQPELSQVLALTEAVEDGWLGCCQVADRRNPDMAHHKETVLTVLEPYTSLLFSLGQMLRAWDGDGAMPLAPTPDDVGAGIDRNSRIKAIRSAYEARLDRHEGKVEGTLLLSKGSHLRLEDLRNHSQTLVGAPARTTPPDNQTGEHGERGRGSELES